MVFKTVVDIDSGNSQIVTNRDGDKMLFYFTGKEIYRVCKYNGNIDVIKGMLDVPSENVVFDVEYFDVFNLKPYSIDMLDENKKEDILGFLLEEVM